MKDYIIASVGFLVFFGMLFFASLYDSTMKQQCRETAMQKSYAPIEVQAICGK